MDQVVQDDGSADFPFWVEVPHPSWNTISDAGSDGS